MFLLSQQITEADILCANCIQVEVDESSRA